ncbi:MAG: helix-turn-helix domain-containing protein [Bacteroidaceae bacterium]|nr:helix-turn-helix domain-containing protein [Bacteroidaceae bacterium]
MLNLMILLPCAAGLFWLALYLVLAPAGRPFSQARIFFLVWFLFWFVAVTPIADKGDVPVVLFTILEEFIGTALIPTAMIYLYAIRQEKARRPDIFFGLCFMLPVALLVAATVAAYISGVENSRELIMSIDSGRSVFSYEEKESFVLLLSTSVAYRFLVIAYFMLLVIVVMVECNKRHYTIGGILRFFFKGEAINLEAAQHFVILVTFFFLSGMMVLGKGYSAGKSWLVAIFCVILTFLISIFGLLASAGSGRVMSLAEVVSRYKFMERERHSGVTAAKVSVSETLPASRPQISDAEVQRHAESVRKDSVYQENPVPVKSKAVPMSVPEDDRLKNCFEEQIVYERLFLQQKVTASDIAEKLGVDKNRVTDYVMTTYGMNLLSYLNMLRINYAEQYMLNNRTATQKQVALSCGFVSASAFNLAFSKYTGVTPKIWLDRYAELTQRNEQQD